MQEKIQQKAERKKQVKELIEKGLTQTEIAKLYGLSVSSISLYAKELNIFNNNFKWYVTRDKILEMYANGMKQSDIARKLKVSRQRVSQVIKKANLGLNQD